MIHDTMVLLAASPKVPLYSAATPATCGLAIEVPLMVLVPLLIQVLVMLLPGAYASTQLPQFEKLDLASLLVLEAVVNTPEALAGDTLHAFWFSFPAATARKIPELARLVAAVFRVVLTGPPSDMLATAGWMPFTRTQSIPA